jgi:hypothetical protein
MIRAFYLEGKMVEATIKYRDIEIKFNESNEKWSCSLGGALYSKAKLSEVKKRIDKFIKDESEFKDMPGIANESWRRMGDGKNFRNITITSVTDDGSAWIRDANGNREEISSYKDIYKDNEKNRKLIEAFETNRASINKIEDENSKIKEELERLSIPKKIND